MEQQMSSLLRKPIKAHQGTIVDGKIVAEAEFMTTITDKDF